MSLNRPTSRKAPRPAKKRTPRDSAESPDMPDFLRQGTASTSPEQTIPAESIRRVASISEAINNKFTSLAHGLISVKEFVKKNEGDPATAEFFDQNKESIDNLLKYDINATYNHLVSNDKNRKDLYRELKENKVITEPELDHLLGVVSTEPLHTFIQSLGHRPPATPPAPALLPLTPDDQARLAAATVENIQTTVDQLQSANKLSQSEADRIIALGPKTDQQIASARDAIFAKVKSHDIRAGTSFSPQYEATIKMEDDLLAEVDNYADQYNQVTKSLVKQIQEMAEQEDREKTREQRLEKLSSDTGLPIKKGQVLWAIDPRKRARNPDLIYPKEVRLEITNIDYTGEEWDPDETADLLPEFRKSIPTLDPVIEFNVQHGTENFNYKVSATKFHSFAIDNQLGQAFENVQELEKELGIDDFVKPGQVLEFLEPKTPGIEENEEAFELRKVTIEKVEDGKVFLSEPVLLDAPVTGGKLRHNRRTQELNLGDFARWYRKSDVVPEFPDAAKLDAALARHHQQLLAEMKWPADQGEPIKLSNFSKPIYLIPAKDPESGGPFVINNVDSDGKIHVSNVGSSGESVHTPTDFYRLIRAKNYTIPNPDQLEVLMRRAADQKEEERLANLGKVYDATTPQATKNAKKNAEPGAPQPKKVGYWKDLWNNSTFLSLMDAYAVFIKAPFDRLKEWFADKAERRQFRVGKEFYKGFPAYGGLNKLATKFDEQLSGKEAKDVTDKIALYEATMSTPDGVFDELHKVGTMSEFGPAKTIYKAAFSYLAKKGLLRLEDDLQLMDSINRLAQLNPNGKRRYPPKFQRILDDPNRPVIAGDPVALAKGISIFDQFEILMDEVYGEGVYTSLNGQNDSEYRRQKKEAYDHFHKYEYLHKAGVNGQLQDWLANWEDGQPVDAAIFEGLLSRGISDLEFSVEQGMMLFVSAFSVTCKKGPNKGKTLLTYSHLETYPGEFKELMSYFYFAMGHNLVDENGNEIMEDGKPKRGKIHPNDFQKLFREHIEQDIKAQTGKGITGSERFTAGKNTINWIQSVCLGAPLVQKKIAKGGFNSNIDTMHYIGPMLNRENELRRILSAGYAGGREDAPVLYNVYAGYNNQLLLNARLLSECDPKDLPTRAENLGKMAFGFLYFHNTLKSRINTDKNWMHFGAKDYNDPTPVDKKIKVGQFADETEDFIREFGMKVAELSRDGDLPHDSRSEFLSQAEHVLSGRKEILDEPTEKAFRNNLQMAIIKLASTRPKELAAIALKASAHMHGMTGTQLTFEERQKEKESKD